MNRSLANHLWITLGKGASAHRSKARDLHDTLRVELPITLSLNEI